MPDFGNMLRAPAGLAKKPETTPADDYPCVIKGYEFGDANKNKTPYLRVQFQPTGAGQGDGSAEKLQEMGIDISKRTLRNDFYLRGKDASDQEALNSAMYRLDQFLRACGVVPDGTKAYEELIPQIVGAHVLVQVKHRVDDRDVENIQTFTDVGKIAPLA